MYFSRILNGHSEHSWELVDGTSRLALFVMDCWNQMDKVVIFDSKVRRQCMVVAVNHIKNFVVSRSHGGFGGLFEINETNRWLTFVDSDRLMRFDALDADVKAFSDADLEKILNSNRVIGESGIIDAIVPDLIAALASATKAIKDKHGVQIMVVGGRKSFGGDLEVKFAVEGDHDFTFWKSVDWSDAYENLHIVPAYHPTRKGQTYVYLLNGCTSAIIRGRAFDSAEPPEGSATGATGFLQGWHTAHPFYARGKSVVLRTRLHEILDADGIADAERFLVCLLGLSSEGFVGVSGGFDPPIPYPSNWHNPRRTARGSEHSCVWQYQTLEKENQLADALIPPWFHTEGWLEAYRKRFTKETK